MSYRLPVTPTLPQTPDSAYTAQLNIRLVDIFRAVYARINDLSDGRIAGIDNAASSVPTVGSYTKGDFVRNSAPAELGITSSKYFIDGWVCVAAGTPGTFVQKRCLTGN